MTTQLVDDRETALRVGYEATDWNAPMVFEDYCAAVKDWTVKVIKRDDSVIGAVYRKDDELHVSILPEWRRIWVTKGLLRQLFSGPKVTTKVTSGHDYMYDILKRLGFKESDGGMLVKENLNGY
jgi:hypothetical protein